MNEPSPRADGVAGWRTGLGWGLAVLAIGIAVYWSTRNLSSEGLLGHEFRQAQTALTARVMAEQGFKLAYETPVLGKPWSIPMEFPLFQGMAAQIAALSGVDILVAARVTALGWFLAGLPAWWLLARQAGYSRSGSALVVVPVALAPVYVFYSRTVMIESTAWALGAWFLWAVLQYRRTGGTGAWVAALLVGALAVLVKATTWAVFCLPWAVLFLGDAWAWWRRREGHGRRLVGQALGIGVPLLLTGFAWVAFADAVKAKNPVANFLLSSELREFNFGRWASRWDPAYWQRLTEHLELGLLPQWALGLALAGCLWTRRTRRLAGLALAAFLGGPLIFFNLYYFHDYYFYANGAFACGLIGMLAAECWDRGGGWRSALPAAGLLITVGYGQFTLYRDGHRATQLTVHSGEYGLVRLLRELTQPEDVIVVHSPSWSSSLPFYARRRMLTIPDSEMFLHADRVRQGVELLADESVPLLVVMGQSRVQSRWTTERIDQLGLWPVPLFRWSNDASVYARIDLFSDLRDRVRTLGIAGAQLDQSEALMPMEQRREIAGTEDGNLVKEQTGIEPHSGVCPFGYFMVGPALLVHARSELFFDIPVGAKRLVMAYNLNPDVYSEKDFDGVCVLVETVAENRVVQSLHFDWLSPHGQPGRREVTLNLPEDRPDRLAFRVLPGPGDNQAFDQLWLHHFRFEP